LQKPGRRWNEVRAVLYGASSLGSLLALASYSPLDPSFNTIAAIDQPANLIGRAGAYSADLLLQTFGLAAFLLPAVLGVVACLRARGREIESPAVKTTGLAALVFSLMAGFALPSAAWQFRAWQFRDAIPPGGLAGRLLAAGLVHVFNPIGTVVVLMLAFAASIYLLTTFSVAEVHEWIANWKARRTAARKNDAEVEAQNERGRRLAAEARAARGDARGDEKPAKSLFPVVTVRLKSGKSEPLPSVTTEETHRETRVLDAITRMQMEEPELPPPPPAPAPAPTQIVRAAPLPVDIPVSAPPPAPTTFKPKVLAKSHSYRLPSTGFLREPDLRSVLNEEELKSLAMALKAKFAEFGVTGSVTQINPGPVVTTFEFKPEAGIKYSRITNLVDDLCLAMEAESILIERIPGKSTIGIEVPNAIRETIYLREMMESREFADSPSKLTLALGKDISGRLRIAELNTMPHLLMAGSTGTGKSVCLNSFLISLLYKATPDDVRLILVDPKRLELGVYDGIPHLLVPIITEPKLASVALKNAVKEMERRLRVLAEKGVRHIEQYNRLFDKPRTLSLFADDGQPAAGKEPETKLPYIVIIIDELADLMMIDAANVETSITRLAQMARAVGIHLILATQRPSVDVITGLIKANFPARISFRVATKVDSRTILDTNGSEALLGKGDMLYLPSGSGRLLRVHGPLVTEDEISKVVEFWRGQSKPNYETHYLAPPPKDESDEDGLDEDVPTGEDDPMYEEAVRIVIEAGKASTSTLQRRLRLGYGRAARLLDIMERDGVISAPDGSRPREVLKRPDWLAEVDNQLR